MRSGLRRARVFNLELATVRRDVLAPFAHGAPFVLGDREWEPASTALRVLEGPALHPADLAHGQGWQRAERAGHDVARALLAALREPAPVAVVAEGQAQRDEVAGLLGAAGIAAARWDALRARLLAGAGVPPGTSALVVAEAPAGAAWLLDAGLALGALGPRAVVVRRHGAPPPPELASVEILELPAGPEAAAAALAARLRLV